MSVLRAAAAPVAVTDLQDHWRPGNGFLFERGGTGIATAGVAAQADLRPGPDQLHSAAAAAQRLLGEIGGPARSEAIVVAALPYDGSVAAGLRVPSRAVRRQDGASRLVLVREDSAPSPNGHLHDGAQAPGEGRARGEGSDLIRRDEDVSPTGAPALPWIREEPDASDYARAVADVVRRIRRGDVEKVVLSRSLAVGGLAMDIPAIIARLRAADPGCFIFASGDGAGPAPLLVGASPELLLRRRGGRVLSVPMGGSSPRSTDPAEDRASAERLLASAKDRREHRLVVEAITDALAPFCTALEVVDPMHLAGTARIWHLGSRVRGTLRDSAPSALGLAAAVHPSPAVCGTPRAAALALIRELEPVPRGLYSGMVGWVDGRGDGEWAVTLRCAQVGGGVARLHAGAGIVEGSDAAAEVAETGAKFSALLDALRVGRSMASAAEPHRSAAS